MRRNSFIRTANFPQTKIGFMLSISENTHYRTKRGDIRIDDVRAMTRKLNQIEDGLRTQLLRDAKAPARVLDQQVLKPAIRGITPLSGFKRGRGRMGWDSATTSKGAKVSADKTQIQFRTSASKTSELTSLVAVKVLNPAVVVSDIAGRSGRAIDRGYNGSGYTREYRRGNRTMRHRINGQGRAMIAALGGHASRYLWPAVEQRRATVSAEIQQVIDKYMRIAQRGLK